MNGASQTSKQWFQDTINNGVFNHGYVVRLHDGKIVPGGHDFSPAVITPHNFAGWREAAESSTLVIRNRQPIPNR